MKCHYEYFKNIGKILIPGCYGTAISNDISQCCCSESEKSIEQRIEELERKVKELINQK